MADGMNTVDYIEAGLRASGVWRAVIAGNLANINTAGYRRRAVEFEQHLARALAAGGGVDEADTDPQIVQPRDTPVNDKGNDVNLDMEVGEMIRNDVRYKTLVRVLARRYRAMESAMRTGS